MGTRLYKMREKYGFTWDGHLRGVKVAKHRVVLNSSDAPPISSAPYLKGLEQREL